MSIDIQTYVDRANKSLRERAEPGFISCAIESEDPPIASLTFETGMDAETHSAKLTLCDVNNYIDDHLPNIVFVRL